MDSNQQMPAENAGELPYQPYPPAEQEEDDEEAVFIDMEEAVEVKVDDGDVPMEEDDEVEQQQQAPPRVAVQDMSKAKFESHSDAVYAIASHYDAVTQTLSILSGGGDDKAFMHKVAPGVAPTSVLLEHKHTDSVSCAAFNLDCGITADLTKTPKLCTVGAYDGAIVLYDPDTGKKLQELEGPSDVEWLCFHPKGGSVLLAGSVADGTVWMYHIPTSKCMQVFVGHESGVTAGAFSPDGKWALSTSQDGTLRVWAPRTGVCKHAFRTGEAGLTCLGLGGGTDGQLSMVGSEDGMAYICHTGTKKIVASLRHFEAPPQAEEEEMELPMSVEAVGFASSKMNWCASGGVDGVLKIWDLTTGQCRQVCKSVAANSGDNNASNVCGITRLKWHPSLPLVFTAAADGTIRLWDARNGVLLQALTGQTDTINDLDVSFLEPDNNGGSAVVIAGGDDKTVRVYEVNIGVALQAASTAAQS